MKILHVEDEAIIALTTKIILERMGHQVFSEITNGLDAIEAVKRENPDLVLCDIIIQGDMDGIATAKELRALGYNVPIIFVTGNSDAQVSEAVAQFENADYMIKPMQPNLLATMVAKFGANG